MTILTILKIITRSWWRNKVFFFISIVSLAHKENNGSAVEFWRIKHAERPPKPPRLEGPLFALSPSKILGQNCTHRKKVDFDASTRQSAEGTLCGWRGALTK